MNALQLLIIRKQNKLSQQQLADVLGVSRSTYCSYETGRRKPDIDVLEKLSKIYKLNIDTIVGNKVDDDDKTGFLNDGENYENQPDTYYLSQLSREERALIIKLRCLEPAERQSIEKLVDEKINQTE